MFFPTLSSYLRMSFVLGTLPVISAAPLSGRPAIGVPAGSHNVRLEFALMTGSAMPITPPGVKHGQSAFGLLAANLVSAAFSQPCSSSAGFCLNALSTSLVWHLRMAATSLATFLLALTSHLTLTLSVDVSPVSSPGHGVAPTVP